MSEYKSPKQRLELLRQALIEGEESGFVDNFNGEEFLANLKNKNMAQKETIPSNAPDIF